MGVKNFVDLCNDLAQTCGERFKPSKLLLDIANRGDSFYGRFAAAKRKAVA
jgi:3-hydroxyacyl-CoA dehydrogenase / enoyl-CoA hydratase / 3-hydroxybutyryl-CoA epimerase